MADLRAGSIGLRVVVSDAGQQVRVSSVGLRAIVAEPPPIITVRVSSVGLRAIVTDPASHLGGQVPGKAIAY